MDRLISWDCFLTNRMAAASAPHSRDSGPICTRVYPCVHSSDVCTLSAANTGHSCMQAEGKGGGLMVRIGLFGGGIVDPRTPAQALLCFRFVACVNWEKNRTFLWRI